MKTALQATPIFSSFLGVGDLEIDHDRVMNWVNSQEVDAHNRIKLNFGEEELSELYDCLLYTSPSPRDKRQSRMPSSA